MAKPFSEKPETIPSKLYPVRLSARALIYHGQKVLCSHFIDATGDYYMIPGGGVQFEETAVEALKREVFEETGYLVTVGELLFVRENIASRLGHTRPRSDFHQLDLVFACELADHERGTPVEQDKLQVDCVWMPLEALPSLRFYPAGMKEAICERRFPVKYVGNIM